MIEIPRPAPIFNPITTGESVGLVEFLAGPLGLAAFVPLIPVLWFLAPRFGRAQTILCTGAAWVVLTAGPWSALVLSGWLAASVAWTHWILQMRNAGTVGPRGGIALAWIGMTLLVLPFWWISDWSWNGWQPSRLQVLHSLGPAYLYLRLLGWALECAKSSAQERSLLMTAAWLAYPPAMRLGPLISRAEFVARLDVWNPADSLPWRRIAVRALSAVLGSAALAAMLYNMPEPRGDADFFAAPERYGTDVLLRVIVNAPFAICIFLWSYNELAAAVALAIGIPLDNNFNFAPLATDIRDFWRRWHITVGAWLRQHIYLPLGGRNANPILVNTVIFGFCALWHGPALSFVVWGAMQAIGMSVHARWDRVACAIGWRDRGRSILWSTLSRAITLAYQFLSVVVLIDFEHAGLRIIPEVARRLWQPGAGS